MLMYAFKAGLQQINKGLVLPVLILYHILRLTSGLGCLFCQQRYVSDTRANYDNHIVCSVWLEFREIFASCGLSILLIMHARMLFFIYWLLVINCIVILFFIFLLVNDMVIACITVNEVSLTVNFLKFILYFAVMNVASCEDFRLFVSGILIVLGVFFFFFFLTYFKLFWNAEK